MRIAGLEVFALEINQATGAEWEMRERNFSFANRAAPFQEFTGAHESN
jgi:hypothetical protein